MRAPVVDYRDFRLRRLNDPRFSHLKYLSIWLFFFVMYTLTENLIPAEACHPMHCMFDDWFPFCEYFIVPYVFWYGLIAFSLLYFALYDIGSFKSLSKYIFVTMVLAMVIYIVYPTRQDLRPAVLPNDNLFSRAVAVLYRIDTNTGVCPSLHVAYSIGIASTWIRRRESGSFTKILMVLFAILIALSTAFVKQHSVIDGAAAIPVCLAAEWLVFYGPWKNRD